MKSKLRFATSTAAVTALLLTFTLTQPYWSTDGPLMDGQAQAGTIDDSDKPQIAAEKPVRYVTFKIAGKQSLAELKSRFGSEGFLTILKINRLDQDHISFGTELIIPTEQAELLAVSPFPREIESVKDIPKFVLVSRKVQAFGAYESGKLVWWGPTSTGKRSTRTPAGLFHTNWRAKSKRSSVNPNWILPWAFNLDLKEGIAFHQYDLPGYPASHGCVRLLESDAKWVFDWADQWILSKPENRPLAYGTPVIIFDEYAYGQTPPWKNLSADPKAASVSSDEIEKLLNKNLPVIAAWSQEREVAIATIAQASAK
jgi:hypothetical protein